MSVLLPDNGGTKEYGERLSGAVRETSSSDSERRGRNRRRPIRIAMAIGVVVAVVIVLVTLSTLPVVSHPYTVEALTSSPSVSAQTVEATVVSNDVGFATLEVPQGAVVTGTWSVQNSTDVGIIIQCGVAGYTNPSATSGSYSLSGNSIGTPGAMAYVYFDVLSPYPVIVTFKGTFTAPVIFAG